VLGRVFLVEFFSHKTSPLLKLQSLGIILAVLFWQFLSRTLISTPQGRFNKIIASKLSFFFSRLTRTQRKGNL
jgi:hypothetical protein